MAAHQVGKVGPRQGRLDAGQDIGRQGFAQLLARLQRGAGVHLGAHLGLVLQFLVDQTPGQLQDLVELTFGVIPG